MFVASCCACVGKCHHVGDCSYCIAHGGGAGFNNPITTRPPIQPPPLPTQEFTFSTNTELQTLNVLTELLKEVKTMNWHLARMKDDLQTLRMRK